MGSVNWNAVAERIGKCSGRTFRIETAKRIGGGCINAAYRVDGEGGGYFVKTNRAGLAAMFEVEALALEEIAKTATVKVPRPICHGVAGDEAYLILEWLLLGHGKDSDRLLGRQLAEMHRTRQPFFGWRLDNTIGSTPQKNPPSDNWCEFWRCWRLGFQLELAAKKGYGRALNPLGEALLSKLDGFFKGYAPAPSLLHGDLWAGNAACTAGGDPVIFDPASYYGDRAADIAMTELFGGFGADFYSVYNEAWPLEPGYGVRKGLYNLYHLLNHLNLFGERYLSGCRALIGRLLAEVG